MSDFLSIKSISQLHEMLGYEKPKHPLVTIIDYSKLKTSKEYFKVKIVTDFYIISLKTPSPKSLQYGRQYYDFEEGTMMFISPNQVFSLGEFNENNQTQHQGYGLYFHPDLILDTSLYNKIQDYTFFSYSVSEALHISEDENQTFLEIVKSIEKEYKANLDKYSKRLIVTAIEQLLNYSQRFYGRQFITRQKLNTDLVSRFEQLLRNYFQDNQLLEKGLPNVDYFANNLNLSSSYLTDLLKKETGKTTKEFIQLEVIEKAKYKLLNSNDTVNEIAYNLGFEYPQYFNRLFKLKTGKTPLEFRQLN
jgi:AraC family transcriptional regulator, transcriptional activator of pobA